MSCIRILPVIALFLIQYTTQSELDRDDVALIVVKPPALRTNDFITIDEVPIDGRRRNKKSNNRGRKKPSSKDSKRPQKRNSTPKKHNIPDDTVVVLLFSNHVVDNMSGGNINFAGVTNIDVKQMDQNQRLSHGIDERALNIGNLIGLVQKLFSQ